jgi:hypothetical protein
VQPKCVTQERLRAYFQADLYVNAKDIKENGVKPHFTLPMIPYFDLVSKH